MKKTSKKVAALMMATMCMAGTTTTFAAHTADNVAVPTAVKEENQIAPLFVAISDCSRLLTLESAWGKMLCSGDTAVYEGYTAGVTVELQKYDGGWTTIKTWSNRASGTFATVDEYYYVENGTYQLKVTHKAYNSNGTEVDSFVAYSDEVTY